MAQEAIRLYIAQLSAFFKLSAPGVSPTATSASSGAPPPFVPRLSNSLTAGVWSNRIVAEIVEAGTELNLGEIGADVTKDWQGLLDSARWKFVDVICETWRLGSSPHLSLVSMPTHERTPCPADSERFYPLEDWIPNAEVPSTTLYLSRVQAFQKHNAAAVYLTVTGMDKPTGSRSKVNQLWHSFRTPTTDKSLLLILQPVPPHYVTKVKNTFFDALYFLLDGMVRLSFQDYEPLHDPMKTKMLVYLGGGNVPLPDVHRIETRTLLTISNFGHLKTDALPTMLRVFETTFGTVTEEDRRTLTEVEDQLDKILFDDFIRRKAVVLQRTIQRGITNGIDWYRAGKPTGA